MNKAIVSDTGPLISLEKLDKGYDFIRLLFDKIIIPPKVLEEVSGTSSSTKSYLKKYAIENLIHIQEVEIINNISGINRLHEGEAQAISLSMQLKHPLLIEEVQGRRIASNSKIKFSGIARQIISAYEKKLIDNIDANEKLKMLLVKKRINKEIFDRLIDQIN